MAAIHYKELLGWYVITLKLRETVESRLPKKSTYGSKIVPDYGPRPSKSEWVISIAKKLAQGRQENMPGSWANLSIYRIPRYLKNGGDKAWVPQIVSLGPYHHGEEHLCHMEQHKWRCLHRIIERSGQGLALYLDSVKKVERRARACYEGRISMSHDEFVEMMVLDGCFAIEMFQGFDKGFEKLGYSPDDPVFSMQELILPIQRDMIMLENQIPLFILDRLLGLQLGYPNQKEHVAKLAIEFFDPLMPKYSFHPFLGKKRSMFDPLYDHRMVHCLEVFRRSLLHLDTNNKQRPKRSNTKQWSQRRQRLIRCLTEVQEAGIKIMSSHSSILGDFKFKDGILQIPQLGIHEWTRSLFLNLMAFELSHFNCRNHITSYVIFMHNLINSPEDVQYLRNRKIIKHCLETDAKVAHLFHQLCQEVASDCRDSYLWDMSLYVGTYCSSEQIYLNLNWRDRLAQKWKDKWSAWRVILINKYLDSPWSIISIIAAVVLLVLTFLQALYAVYGYYKLSS